MRLLDVNLRKVIRWSVNTDFPDIIWSPSRTFGILNPLIHHALRKRQLPELEQMSVFSNGGVDVLITDSIGIMLTGEKTDHDVFDWVIDRIPLLVSCLRTASGQLIINPDTMSVADVELTDLPSAEFRKDVGVTQAAAPATIRESAITPDDMRLALEYFETSGPPSPRSMLVDALHAYFSSDYKKAIVYAAIAMESVGATTLDREFDQALAEGGGLQRFRVIELNQAGGAVVTKDPVFSLLRESIKFKSLLHELSLYVRNRSLLVENQGLYSQALRVYKTRNDIVHHAEPRGPEDSAALRLDRETSRTAVDCALSVCQWFGEGLRFGLYDQRNLTYDRYPV
jgi:hypothetical protein